MLYVEADGMAALAPQWMTMLPVAKDNFRFSSEQLDEVVGKDWKMKPRRLRDPKRGVTAAMNVLLSSVLR